MDYGEIYAQGRRRITELVGGLRDDDAAARVPTCPEWRVADVVAHLAGISADILAGNIAGIATDEWTHAQVAARRGRPLADVIAQWSEDSPRVEEAAVHIPERVAKQWVMDLTSHEHDLRCALGRPGARDSAGVRVALDFLVGYGLDASLRAHGLPALEVLAGDHLWVAGDGDPVGRLDVDPFDLLRALSGRRSERQVRALPWPVDPEPYLPALRFGPFRFSKEDIDE